MQGFKINLGLSGLDKYSSRYMVGGSSVISKVFGGNPVNCRKLYES
jgi:hypothetical protein